MANVELEFITCTASSHPSALPFLLFILFLPSFGEVCCPPLNVGETERGKNSYFSSVFP